MLVKNASCVGNGLVKVGHVKCIYVKSLASYM